MPPRKREGRLEDVKYSVHNVKTLGWAADDRAQELLNRAVSYGNVILKRHRWTVVTVSEFYPRSQNLLGLNENKGEHIKVRMRKPKDKNQFFDFEEIMCTLLHEIVHCTISPHYKPFWKLYHELVEECELIQVEEEYGRPSAVYGLGGVESIAPEFGMEGADRVPVSVAASMVPFSGSGRVVGSSNNTEGSTGPSAGGHVLGGADSASEGLRQHMLDSLLRRNPQIGASAARPSAGGGTTSTDGADPTPRHSRLLDVFTQREQESRATGDGECASSQRPSAALPAAALPADDPVGQQRRRQRLEDDAAPTATAGGRGGGEGDEGGSPWACQVCGFLNHPLLPYCESCCSEDVKEEDVKEGSADDVIFVTDDDPPPPSSALTAGGAVTSVKGGGKGTAADPIEL